MKIKEIKINNYGNIENKEIKLEKNINIIYGKNESGKSTLLNYVKCIFYGISKNKNGRTISDYDKYKPWGKEDFSGKLKYELDDGKEFEIFRDFNKKNPKIFNSEMEDISKEFDIAKKDGLQFFYNQTNVDETMFTSTVLSMQQEVKLDGQDQNILLQKLANLAGTGEDNLSYKKVVDKLNKKQLEEIGTDRSQGRPINIVKDKIKKIEIVLKDIESYQNDKQELRTKVELYNMKIRQLSSELELLKRYTESTLCNQKEQEKVNIKIEYIKEKTNKIQELDYEKNNLIKKDKLNKEENIKNKLNSKLIKKYLLGLLFLLIINILIFILNKNYLKNNFVNIINYSIIPIYLIIIFILEKNKNEKIKNKVKLENKKINEEINLIEKQIEILNEEKNKIEKEIKSQQLEIDNKIEENIENIKKEYKGKIDVNEYIQKIEENDLNTQVYKLQDEINKYKLELQAIKLQEEDKTKRLEDLASLKEEYELQKEELKELEEKNESINLAKEFLNRAYIKMKNNITPKFTENLSENISSISNNKYTKVGINDEKGIIVENEYGEYIPAERLSIGTIDQLYLSLRLSMIDELSNEKMPILLDESFAYFDDARLENMLEFLSKKMNEHQVIIFTCTRREKDILDKLNIEYNFVEM